jgi:Helix-turn-helix domain
MMLFVMEIDPKDELLTPAEVRKLLKISKTSLWRWDKQGLKSMGRGRFKRYRRSDVEVFWQAQEPRRVGVMTLNGLQTSPMTKS